jgi:putative chitinase
MIDFTEAELRRFAPKMAEFYRRALLDGKAHLADAGVLNNGKRLAHFLAQVGAETGGGTILRESLNYTSAKRIAEVWPARAKKSSSEELRSLVRNPVGLGDWAYGGRLGNRKGKIGKPHSDGYDFRGGGWLQTTGRANVQKYCDLCKIEIRPDILDDPIATLQFACAEWKDAGCNELADANDLMGISKAINTGSAASGIMPNGMEHRTAWFKRARAIWWDADMKATETVSPPAPVSVPAMLRTSRTVGGLFTAVAGGIAYIFREAVEIFVEAAAQFDALAPIAKVLTALGLSVAAGSLILAAAGIALSFFAKLDDTVKGNVVK